METEVEELVSGISYQNRHYQVRKLRYSVGLRDNL